MRKMFFQSVTQEAQTKHKLLTGFKTFGDPLVTNPDGLQYATGATATKLGPYVYMWVWSTRWVK